MPVGALPSSPEHRRLLTGRIPAPRLALHDDDDAAVERATQVPLPVTQARRGTAVPLRIEAHDEVVAPVEGGVRNRCRDVHELAVPRDPNAHGARRRGDLE